VLSNPNGEEVKRFPLIVFAGMEGLREGQRGGKKITRPFESSSGKKEKK